MIIDRITLYNYRLYKGNNTINFQINSSKNLFLISGENGFGKTTFLHSLIWCLYGKLVSETETDIRKDISNAGYLNYIKEGLNHEAREELLKIQALRLCREETTHSLGTFEMIQGNHPEECRCRG